MTKNKISIIIASLILIVVYIIGGAVISYSFNKMQLEDVDGGAVQVAVITKSTTSDFWNEVEAGANTASVEYNLHISFEGPDNEEDYATQNRLIEEAVADGVQVIVFSAIDYNANAEAVEYAISQGVHVVSIDSDVNSAGVKYHIGTDNYMAGYMAGEAALEAEEEALRVGIVNFDKNSANGQEREAGFMDCINEDPRLESVVGINVLSTTEEAKEETLRLFEENPDLNVIATFNEWTSLGVGYAIEELGIGDETTVVAFDNNTISIGMLERGNVDALIVQNPFAMGYLGVEYAYELINEVPIETSDVDTKTTLVTQDLMYEEEYQRVLFPFD